MFIGLCILCCKVFETENILKILSDIGHLPPAGADLQSCTPLIFDCNPSPDAIRRTVFLSMSNYNAFGIPVIPRSGYGIVVKMKMLSFFTA